MQNIEKLLDSQHRTFGAEYVTVFTMSARRPASRAVGAAGRPTVTPHRAATVAGQNLALT